MDIFVARQPVFDRDEQLLAYELCYGKPAGVSDDATASLAAERLMVEVCLGPGLAQLAEGKPVFLPVSRSLLMQNAVRVIHPRRVVLMFAPDTRPDRELIVVCEALIQQGYRFASSALDALASPELLRLSGIVTLNASALAPEELAMVAGDLRQRGARLLADRVANRTMRDRCQAAGVDLFKGYLFTRPEVLARHDIGIDHAQTFKLLKMIKDPKATETAIEDAFRKDVALTYKLLRLVNSAAMGRSGVYTIGHAIRLVGRDTLYRWLSLLLVSSVTERGVEIEIAHLALARARLCERIADVCGLPKAGGPLFMVGLFSMLDVLLQTPLVRLVQQLELASDVAAALTDRADFYGAILALVEAYEQGDWPSMGGLCDEVGIAADAIPDLYVEAIQWSRVQLQDTVAQEQSTRMLRTVSATVKAL